MEIRTTTDQLLLIETLGDYVRNRRPPGPDSIIMGRIARQMGNGSLLLMFLEETTMRWQDLEERFHQLEKSSVVKDAHSLHSMLLPGFDHLHSVLHGWDYWLQKNPDQNGGQARARILKLMQRNHQLIHNFGETGLHQRLAMDILAPLGRELIDPDLMCWRALPENIRDTSRDNDLHPSSIPPAFPKKAGPCHLALVEQFPLPRPPQKTIIFPLGHDHNPV